MDQSRAAVSAIVLKRVHQHWQGFASLANEVQSNFLYTPLHLQQRSKLRLIEDLSRHSQQILQAFGRNEILSRVTKPVEERLVNSHDHAVEGAAPVWVVRNKIDLSAVKPHVAGMGRTWGGRYFEISASRGDGLQELMAALVGHAENYFGSDEGGLIGRERQRTLLRETAASLQRSMEGKGEELVAEDLRSAAHSLGRLLGRVDVEDILDVIFREFCIGK